MLFACNVSYAATVNQDSVKAAFIYHFINFIQWEDNKPECYVCIPDDKALRDTSQQILEGKIVNDRKIMVVKKSQTCHIMVSNYYMSSMSAMLTIGDLNKGASLEFRTVNNKLKFAINLNKIKNSHLKISSQLLKLAISE